MIEYIVHYYFFLKDVTRYIKTKAISDKLNYKNVSRFEKVFIVVFFWQGNVCVNL